MNTATAEQEIDSDFNRDRLSFDIEFDVPQTQRLRFTQNVFENDARSWRFDRSIRTRSREGADLGRRGASRGPLGSKVTASTALNEQLHIEAIPEIKYVMGGEAVKRDPKLIDETCGRPSTR